MARAVSGSRLTLITVVLSIAVTAAFHWLYSDVAITAGLQLEFVLIAFLLALAVEWAIYAIRKTRAAQPVSPPGAPPEKKEPT